jgi:hypothetical protein
MHEKYLLERLKGRSYLEDLGIDSSVTMKLILNKQDGTVGTGLIWLVRGTSGGPFMKTIKTFGFFRAIFSTR